MVFRGALTTVLDELFATITVARFRMGRVTIFADALVDFLVLVFFVLFAILVPDLFPFVYFFHRNSFRAALPHFF
jgi:hypothetical protein